MNTLILKSLLFGIITAILVFAGFWGLVAFIIWLNLPGIVWFLGILFLIVAGVAAIWRYDYYKFGPPTPEH